MKLLCCAAIMGTATGFLSCLLNGVPGAKTERITVTLPIYPKKSVLARADSGVCIRPLLASWLVVAEDGEESFRQFVGAEARTIALRVRKNRLTSVLCYPLNPQSAADSGGVSSADDSVGGFIIFFAPAGCIYPISTAAEWSGGFEAKVLQGVFRGTGESTGDTAAFCSRFNWARFHREIDALVGEDARFNPWLAAKQTVAGVIADNAFSKNTLKPPKPAEVTVNAPDGTFFSPYVPDAPFAVSGGAFSYLYYEAADHTLFDGNAVFLVQNPARSGRVGNAPFVLARMPHRP
ncbi:hypothetical protein [Treponema endosymbiont of Eucomonympha sp.]|uniref:hypothetical protein n=1 Tax=Treponema endosymbiont of Eucomonympha sp. TaxID=1580831 RepID=UPI000A7A4406|nr:hypothetical protein [Treponema endosymbiont of Eucomonympha sp.]